MVLYPEALTIPRSSINRDLQTLQSLRFLQSNLRRLPVTELGHVHILDTQSLGLMRSPLNVDPIIQIRPTRMMLLDLALIRNERHEPPGLCETGKCEGARDTLPRSVDLPCRREAGHAFG